MTCGPDLVVCDLAGTTVADAGGIAEAFTEALAGIGVTADAGDILAVRGTSKRAAFAALAGSGPDGAARAAAAYAAFCRAVRRAFGAAGFVPMPGAIDALAALRANGARIALTTGFERRLARPLLEGPRATACAGLLDVVDLVVYGDDVSVGRPAPYMIFRAMEGAGARRVDRLAVAGDTAADLEAGRNAGARWNIGVAAGAHGRARLAQAPHTHLIDAIRDLPHACSASPAPPGSARR